MAKKITLFLLLTLLISGCGTEQPTPTETTSPTAIPTSTETTPSPTPVSQQPVEVVEIPLIEDNEFLEMFPDSTYTAKMIDGRIPIFESYKDNGNLQKPLVIMLHGANGHKESMGYLQGLFTNAGFYVISIDLRAHGQREIEQVSFADVLTSTGQDIDRVIDYAKTNEQIDADKFGMLGFSMGGMICYWYAANGQYTPTIIAPTASTPDWNQLQDLYLVDLMFENGESTTVPDNHQTEVAKLTVASPHQKPEEFMNTTLIIGHGAKDDLILPIGDQTFYQTMLGMSHPRVEYHEFPEARHHIPGEFIPIMVRTFSETLTPKP